MRQRLLHRILRQHKAQLPSRRQGLPQPLIRHRQGWKPPRGHTRPRRRNLTPLGCIRKAVRWSGYSLKSYRPCRVWPPGACRVLWRVYPLGFWRYQPGRERQGLRLFACQYCRRVRLFQGYYALRLRLSSPLENQHPSRCAHPLIFVASQRGYMFLFEHSLLCPRKNGQHLIDTTGKIAVHSLV